MSSHTDTNQSFPQVELEQLVSIVLENMKTKNDRFYPHRFQLFKSLGLKRLLELFKTNDLPSWVVDACVSDRDEENHWSWYDLCNIPDELLLNYIDTFGKDSHNKYLAGIQRQRTLLAYSLIVLLAKNAFHTKVLIYGCRIKKSWMTDGTAKSFPSFTTSAFNKIDKTTATKRKAEQYESCLAFVRHIDTKCYTLHNLIQFNSTLLAERYTFNRLQAKCCAGCGTWQRLTVGTLSRPDSICISENREA